ncbi:hypothetical protein VSWAT3_12852 [Vibrionales bacterium SWAT-3]|nr:hypothetical protein VSWAT3_12852 [Vibrionales bacterium SWAT-3]
MSSYKYERLLSTTIDNALLHLWISVANSRNHVSRDVRNQILVRWFKPKINKIQYKTIKKEIKSIIQAGKYGTALLEERLCELRELSQSYRDSLNDMHKLHYLLEYLREDHEITADLNEGVSEYLPSTLYVSQAHLEQCFSDEQQQIKPLSVTLSNINVDNFIHIVQLFGFHKVELNTHPTSSLPIVELSVVN